MKSIELNQDVFDALTELASRRGISPSEYIAGLPEIRDHQRKNQESALLAQLDPKKYARYDYYQKFGICLLLMHRSNPSAFYTLDGFTKPNGRAVFISKSESVIKESAQSARPTQLSDTGYWFNAQGSHADFESLIEQMCGALKFSATFKNALIQKVMRAEIDYAAMFADAKSKEEK